MSKFNHGSTDMYAVAFLGVCHNANCQSGYKLTIELITVDNTQDIEDIIRRKCLDLSNKYNYLKVETSKRWLGAS